MLRKTLIIVSLVGLTFSLGLWGISYWAVFYTTHDVAYSADSCLTKGALAVHTYRDSTLRSIPHGWRFTGFKVRNTAWLPKLKRTKTVSGFILPLWIPTVLFAVYPLCLMTDHNRRSRRRKLGLCVKCGYDLHGLTEPRCSECGTPFYPVPLPE